MDEKERVQREDESRVVMRALLGKEQWLQVNSQNVDEIDEHGMPWSRKLDHVLFVRG